MKVAVSRTTTLRRPTPLRRKLNQTKSQQPKQGDKETKSDPSDLTGGTKSLQDGLAICLFGLTANMYISEDEEEVRKRVIMSVSRHGIPSLQTAFRLGGIPWVARGASRHSRMRPAETE